MQENVQYYRLNKTERNGVHLLHPPLFRDAKLLTIIQRYLLNKAQKCG